MKQMSAARAVRELESLSTEFSNGADFLWTFARGVSQDGEPPSLKDVEYVCDRMEEAAQRTREIHESLGGAPPQAWWRMGQKVKALRAYKGMTQRELHETSGVSLASLSKIEQGRQRPHPASLKRLADALDITVKELMS